MIGGTGMQGFRCHTERTRGLDAHSYGHRCRKMPVSMFTQVLLHSFASLLLRPGLRTLIWPNKSSTVPLVLLNSVCFTHRRAWRCFFFFFFVLNHLRYHFPHWEHPLAGRQIGSKAVFFSFSKRYSERRVRENYRRHLRERG